jgi:hypothetical protein
LPIMLGARYLPPVWRSVKGHKNAGDAEGLQAAATGNIG